ncbi:type II toxin-antitoxin system ParD family antitoxin [Brevundimonas kwangchunensis]|uniref:Type II toxin-antitoxin system ParD family antitoxin n=1 Tax=Brevundimonas kwangchunensis TaxID=322163 RepID=A0ABN1H3I8_9CAUL
MATMNVSLPDAMKEWVEGRAETGRYSNSSDYVRDLIRKDQERLERIQTMQQFVDEALTGPMGDRSMADIRAEARRRLEQDAQTEAEPGC